MVLSRNEVKRLGIDPLTGTELIMTTATSTARGSRKAPATAGNIKAALKAGEKPAVATKTTAKKDENTVYVTALREAFGWHKNALHVEMAVNLVFFANQEKVDKKVRAALRPIYERAGYDCKTPAGEDYKTVQRRTDVAARLFEWLGGHESIHDWIEDAKPAEAIKLVTARLEKQRFDSIQSIRRAVDKERYEKEVKAVAERKAQAAAQPAQAAPVQAAQAAAPAQAEAPAAGNQPSADEAVMLNEAAATSDAREAAGVPAASAKQDRRAVDKLPQERVFRTEHMVVAIPLEATQAEVMEMASNLMMFARNMQPVTAH
jgi:hypothetical protein